MEEFEAAVRDFEKAYEMAPQGSNDEAALKKEVKDAKAALKKSKMKVRFSGFVPQIVLLILSPRRTTTRPSVSSRTPPRSRSRRLTGKCPSSTTPTREEVMRCSRRFVVACSPVLNL
jgi:hypothetical protein